MASNKCQRLMKCRNKAIKHAKGKGHLTVLCYLQLENSDLRHLTMECYIK